MAREGGRRLAVSRALAHKRELLRVFEPRGYGNRQRRRGASVSTRHESDVDAGAGASGGMPQRHRCNPYKSPRPNCRVSRRSPPPAHGGIDHRGADREAGRAVSLAGRVTVSSRRTSRDGLAQDEEGSAATRGSTDPDADCRRTRGVIAIIGGAARSRRRQRRGRRARIDRRVARVGRLGRITGIQAAP